MNGKERNVPNAKERSAQPWVNQRQKLCRPLVTLLKRQSCKNNLCMNSSPITDKELQVFKIFALRLKNLNTWAKLYSCKHITFLYNVVIWGRCGRLTKKLSYYKVNFSVGHATFVLANSQPTALTTLPSIRSHQSAPLNSLPKIHSPQSTPLN